MQKLCKKLPNTIIACVGKGSNATKMFAPFIKNLAVKLVRVKASSKGLDSTRHAAMLGSSTKGILHGIKTYILQNKYSQINNTYSILARLDYPSVKPELAFWKDSN